MHKIIKEGLYEVNLKNTYENLKENNKWVKLFLKRILPEQITCEIILNKIGDLCINKYYFIKLGFKKNSIERDIVNSIRKLINEEELKIEVLEYSEEIKGNIFVGKYRLNSIIEDYIKPYSDDLEEFNINIDTYIYSCKLILTLFQKELHQYYKRYWDDFIWR